MQRLVMVRHGETDFNVRRRLQGRSDTVLNATGLQQVEYLAQALRSERVDAIWCSPLKRARQTAERINQHFQLAIEEKSGLIERSFGHLEGATVEALIAAEETNEGPLNEFAPGGGESLLALQQRARMVLADLHAQPFNTLLIVAHAGIIRALIGELLDWDIARWHSITQHNACMNTFQFGTDGEVVAYQLDDNAHCWPS